jgi:hypothetical protein
VADFAIFYRDKLLASSYIVLAPFKNDSRFLYNIIVHYKLSKTRSKRKGWDIITLLSSFSKV